MHTSGNKPFKKKTFNSKAKAKFEARFSFKEWVAEYNKREYI